MSEGDNPFGRSVKTYVIRAGRTTESEKRNYRELAPRWCVPLEQRQLDFATLFHNTSPVVIEIGFGMGQATAQIAQEHPSVNYLAIDVHVPGIGRLLGEIQRRALSNLLIIQGDALDVLEAMIPRESVAGFHVFFPDPWPKKKHHKRRLVRRPNTDLFAQKLMPGGYIYFATDWPEYAAFALCELLATESLVNTADGFCPHKDWRPITKFEQKGLDAGRKTWELYFLKQGAHS